MTFGGSSVSEFFCYVVCFFVISCLSCHEQFVSSRRIEPLANYGKKMGNRIEPFVNSGSCSLPLSDFILCFFVSISSLFFPFLRPKEFRGICLSLASSYESFSPSLFCAANRKIHECNWCLLEFLTLIWEEPVWIIWVYATWYGTELEMGSGYQIKVI